MSEQIYDRATKYAEAVCAGLVPCGHLHYLACKRHLEDLKRQNTEDFPYHWDVEKSQDIIDFAETLTIIEGKEPKIVKLYGSQCFDLGVLMGWFDKEGFRRFRRRYVSMARQNGKTFLNGIIAGYIAGFDGYRYGKLFTVATSKKQARLTWDEVKKFIIADEDLSEYFDITEYKYLITALNTDCTIEALSKEAGLEDGARSIYASVDEIHQHKDNSIYKAIYNGQRSLDEALCSMITTRGKDTNSFCYEMDSYCVSIIEGEASAEDFFVDIYCLDKGDDIFDPECFIKSNPVLCATERGKKTMLTDAQTAKAMGGSDLADFICKCQNMWVEDPDKYFATSEMLKKAWCRKTLEDFRDYEAYAGLDLSHGGDLTTVSLEFEYEDGFYTWSMSFMPRGRLEEHKKTDLAPYDLWEQKELIRVTGGANDYKNDYGFIITELKRVIEEYGVKLKGIGYDPHNADGFLKDLEVFDVPLQEVRQSAKFLNDGTVDIQLLMKSGLYHFNENNELLTWSFKNAVLVKNSFGEKKIDKIPKARHKRIDPVDAAIDAHIARIKITEFEQIDANKHMEEYLKAMGWNERKNT